MLLSLRHWDLWAEEQKTSYLYVVPGAHEPPKERRTQIERDSEKAEVKMTNSAGDKIVEYAIHYAQDGSYPPNLTKEKKRAVRNCVVLTAIIIKGFVTAMFKY